MISVTLRFSLSSANALVISLRVKIPIIFPSPMTGAPSISLVDKTFAASLILKVGFKVIKSLLATSITFFLGILRIPVVSRSRILSISSLPTTTPLTINLFTGVGPILILSPKSIRLILPMAFIAASHSPGCGILVNSILATVISFNSFPPLKIGT